jgi:hypothetical protein
MRLILQVDQEGEKEMKTTLSVIGIVVLGLFLLTAAGISPAVGETNKLGGNEGPVMEASGTASFGTEDWVGPKEQAPIVAVKTPSFGTEDWVGAKEQAPIVAVNTPSFGTEDWVGAMESSEALGAGTIPEPAR